MNILKSAALAAAILFPTALGAQARYLGQATLNENFSPARNSHYWSVGTEVNGKGHVLPARQVLSTGVAQADFRICTYEDGSPICENGKYFFCVSSRLAGLCQTVYEYDINTCSLNLIGTIQGYSSEGSVKEVVAPHIICNRMDGCWYVFAHWEAPHNLCVGKTMRDPRFGYSEVAFSLLDYEGAAKGDEDNFVYFDKELSKWVLVYSRKSDTISKQYSDSIDRGYRLICSNDSERSLTGINVVPIGGTKYLISGFGWSPAEDAYKVFSMDDLSYICDLSLDMPTGGFRGWGTVIPIPEGMETKYQLLTFDRINPTGVNSWQYGNIYLYEARERNSGTEYEIKRAEGCVIPADPGRDLTPGDLHFVRKFSTRHNYDQEIRTGEINLGARIFMAKGTIYPVTDSSATVRCRQDGSDVAVSGKGRFSLLGGTHLPNCEYVIDLTGLERGEKRYLSIRTLEENCTEITFEKSGKDTLIRTDAGSSLAVPGGIRHIRVVIHERKAYFLNAD